VVDVAGGADDNVHIAPAVRSYKISKSIH
jgi:hypothetical protein